MKRAIDLGEIWIRKLSLENTLFAQAKCGINHLQVFPFNFKDKADTFKNKKILQVS